MISNKGSIQVVPGLGLGYYPTSPSVDSDGRDNEIHIRCFAVFSGFHKGA